MAVMKSVVTLSLRKCAVCAGMECISCGVDRVSNSRRGPGVVHLVFPSFLGCRIWVSVSVQSAVGMLCPGKLIDSSCLQRTRTCRALWFCTDQ